MIYLIIMLLLAGVGLANLWTQQRRQRAHLETVAGFKASLQKIAPHAAPGPFRNAMRSARRPQSKRAPGRAVQLDPARREAARRRVEERRRAALARTHRRAG